ncbi:hypothetical protein [Bacteroides caecigallinarum]|uniref:hypothetical protein n=1 Tax=Bacteroides caecigallinarum TaxID=1411144 RepID=UPI001F188C14|nr:hypothetical protein [Bacteroides caecigallinarum]MCF2583131.1 hypothetical protein [Bacteroides caecigallinarum]
MQHIQEIESIFNPRYLDEDCGYIAVLLREYEIIISKSMDSGNYKDAVTLLLAILDSLTRHFVEDEHYTYFDDMYSPEYVCQTIIEKMNRKAEAGLFPVEEIVRLKEGLEKVKQTEAYRDYGALMFALRCFKY